MLLYTEVYLVDKDQPDFLPEGDAEAVSCTVNIKKIDYAYPLGENHTQIGMGDIAMKINTAYEYVQKCMVAVDNESSQKKG